MSTVARFDGDLRVTGSLQVDGNLPTITRADISQNANSRLSVPMTAFRVWDAMGSVLPSSSSADDIGIAGGTFGTNSPKLTTGDVKTTTVTRYGRVMIPLPENYEDGETVTLRLHAGMETTVSDGTATVDVEAYKSDSEAGIGSDLCSTAAQSINSLTFADKDFTITPTGLSAGDMLDVRVTLAVSDTATGTAVTATIGAVELLADTKG